MEILYLDMSELNLYLDRLDSLILTRLYRPFKDGGFAPPWNDWYIVGT